MRLSNERTNTMTSRCDDPDCRGWFRDGETGEIARCDACGVFVDDWLARIEAARSR